MHVLRFNRGGSAAEVHVYGKAATALVNVLVLDLMDEEVMM